MLFEFWNKLPPNEFVHPEDRPILDQHPGIFQTSMPPGHINGPLKSAPVIACYLNPGFEDEDAALSQSAEARETLFQQIGGESEFPLHFDRWKKWYLARVGRIDMPAEKLARTVAVFNACAYASKDAKHLKTSIVKNLPSSKIARRYLHEVLIPQARRGERFIVIGRGAWAWEVDRPMECETIRFAPNPKGGHFGLAIGTDITRWLKSRTR